MNPALHVTPRDQEILEALVQKVRLFSQRQIAHHWWHNNLANTRRRLDRLCNQNLLVRIAVQARPVPFLEAPLVSWQPGQPAPDFGAIAHRCQKRWRGRPTRPCTAWIASRHIANLYGGVGRGTLQHPLQATHDLALAAVWLRLHEIAPHQAAAWRSEDLLAPTRRGEKLPDAFLVDANGQVLWVVEFGGGYDTPRVREFHEDCAVRRLPYQLW